MREPEINIVPSPLWKPGSPLSTVILTCLVAIACYQADRLVDMLGIPPDHIASFWPATPLLVAVLLLAPRRNWPVLIAAGLGAMALADLKDGVPMGFELWFSLGNLADVLIVTLGLNHLFDGAPRLNSVKNLAKYVAVAVISAPLVSSIVGAIGSVHGGYYLQGRIWFFADALAFVTVTPAILSWAHEARAWARQSRNYLELLALLCSVIVFGYLTFIATGRADSPALLYSLVPLLLWAALRLGLKGVSTSMLVIVLLSTWGAALDRGPFVGQGPLKNVLSLQLFLFFAAIPFMVLAVLVEEEKRTNQELIDEHAQLTEAQRLAQVGSWHWDPATDTVTWSEQLYRIAGRDPHLPAPSYKEHGQHYTPESWKRLQGAVEESIRTGRGYELDVEMVRSDGTTRWLIARGEAQRVGAGHILFLRGTVKDITDRKRAEQSLRESEERFRLVADTAPVFIWMSAKDKLCTFFNKGWLDFTGRSMEQEMGEGWTSGVHPDDLAHCLRTYSRAFDARAEFEMEYRLRRFDGKYRWVSDYGVPRFEADGAFCGYIGSCVDITDRKATEESLEELSGRLIAAQEEERTRIARELHDDFSQRLALLGIGLGRLWEKRPESEEDERILVGELWSRTEEICSDVHRLSHRLHSSKLEHVGLRPTLRGLCEEISEKQGIEVKFTEGGVSSEIPKDVALCLFRVAQEALSNVVKHSQARQARVELCAADGEIRLRIVDSGAGFDPEFRNAVAGIGLVSMQERLRLVGGHLSVQSSPLRGTEILAAVPLSASPNRVKTRVRAVGE
jgi:PAS domain S-box-containing protein